MSFKSGSKGEINSQVNSEDCKKPGFRKKCLESAKDDIIKFNYQETPLGSERAALKREE
jgi:hypothetical protein